MNTETPEPLRLIIHAVDAESLQRARNNALNFLKARPAVALEIVVNAGAVAAALDAPHETDRCLRLCANTLHKQQLEAPAHLAVVDAAVVYIAERQRDGWAYLRA